MIQLRTLNVDVSEIHHTKNSKFWKQTMQKHKELRKHENFPRNIPDPNTAREKDHRRRTTDSLQKHEHRREKMMMTGCKSHESPRVERARGKTKGRKNTRDHVHRNKEIQRERTRTYATRSITEEISTCSQRMRSAVLKLGFPQE